MEAFHTVLLYVSAVVAVVLLLVVVLPAWMYMMVRSMTMAYFRSKKDSDAKKTHNTKEV